MYTLTYEQFRNLRKNPILYWNPKKAERKTREELIMQIIRVLVKNPKCFDDHFIFAPDLSDQNPAGIEMMEIYAERVLDFLHNASPEIPNDVVTQITEASARKVGLPKNYEPTPELVKYGEYLLVRDERTEITKELETEARAYFNRLKPGLILAGDETSNTSFPNLPSVGITPYGVGDMSKLLVWPMPKVVKTIELKSERKSRKIPIGLDGQIDHIIYRKDQETAEVTNFYICDNILNFEDLYRKEELNQLIGFQKLALQGSFKNVVFYFYVMDKYNKYAFPVETIPDITEELSKALYTIEAASYLPYEYDKKAIKL